MVKPATTHTHTHIMPPKSFSKGSKSKTMRGKRDFTTKSTSKMFDRGGHRLTFAQGGRGHHRPFGK